FLTCSLCVCPVVRRPAEGGLASTRTSSPRLRECGGTSHLAMASGGVGRCGALPSAHEGPSAAAAASNHRGAPRSGLHRVKEVAMTWQVRLWITAVLSIAATALMVGLTIAAQAGVNQTHTNPPLAGIAFNAID